MENASKAFVNEAAGAPTPKELEGVNKDRCAEPLPEEELDKVAGGRLSRAEVEFKLKFRKCPAGVWIEHGTGCRSCRHYHETATHYCSVLERKGRS